MIKRLSLADEVAARLTEYITTLPIGTKLPTEPELMQLYGVGRSSVREAVRNLSQIGLVRVKQGLGTFVEKHQTPVESLEDRFLRAKGLELNEVRQLIELKIAEKAALNRTDDDILQIRKHLEIRKQMALAHRPGPCIQADIDFHLGIAVAAKSDILLDLYKMVAEHLQRYFLELYIDTESFILTQDLHEALLQSIVDQQPQKAWELAATITGQPI